MNSESEKPGLLNQATEIISALPGKIQNGLSKTQKAVTNQFVNTTNRAKKLGEQVVNTHQKARTAVGEVIEQRKGNVQNIIAKTQATVENTVEKGINAAKKAGEVVVEEADKRAKNLKKIHRNATGTTRVLKKMKKRIKANGNKTRKEIAELKELIHGLKPATVGGRKRRTRKHKSKKSKYSKKGKPTRKNNYKVNNKRKTAKRHSKLSKSRK